MLSMDKKKKLKNKNRYFSGKYLCQGSGVSEGRKPSHGADITHLPLRSFKLRKFGIVSPLNRALTVRTGPVYENPAELNGTPDFNVKRSVASVKTLGPLAQACFSAKGLGKHLVPERRDAAL